MLSGGQGSDVNPPGGGDGDPPAGDGGRVSDGGEGTLPEGSWASSTATRTSMLGNRRRDTTPELAVRRLLHAMGLRYRVDYSLPFDRRRKADVVFPRQRVAVFIDGCFWHGCPQHYIAPKAHGDYWRSKVEGNRHRDSQTTSLLEERGWQVLRFWEHDSAAATAATIADAVRTAAGRTGTPGSENPGPSD